MTVSPVAPKLTVSFGASAFTSETCVRVARETAPLSPLAGRWSAASGAITASVSLKP